MEQKNENNGTSKVLKIVYTTLGVVGFFVVIGIAWGALSTRVANVESKMFLVDKSREDIASINTNLTNIKEMLIDVKKKVDIIYKGEEKQ